MHSRFTNILLDLTELSISYIENVHDDVLVDVQPTDYVHPCPKCQKIN